MPRAGIEPATRGFSVLCSTNWAIWADCGGRIWTYDLRVMSPTSFQTAPPRDILLCASYEAKPMIGLEPITCWLQISCSANWATSARIIIDLRWERIRTVLVLANDSHFAISGWGRIRTFEGVANRFTVCPLWPLGNPSILSGAYRARTYDPLLVRQMLSQLS